MKLVKKIIILLVVVGLGFFIYKFFFACNKVNAGFNQNFTLNVLDYAKIKDEVWVKLLSVKDRQCKEEDCQRGGQIEYNLVVISDRRLQFVTLSTLEKKTIEIKKTNYVLELVDGTSLEQATFKLNYIEEKEK